MKTVIANQNVEWDDNKAAINKQKHGISFGTAAMVFADENRVERYDGKPSQDEDRWQVIGMVNDVLFVVYTERTDAVRIIMAREVSPKERSEYFDYSTSYL